MTRFLAYSCAVLLAGLVAFSASSVGQDPETESEPRNVTFTLKSGKSVHGVIVGSEEERVQLRLSVAGGTATRWYSLADFDDRSQVRVKREQVAEGDWLAQLGVAEFAAERGLIDLSRTELRRCVHMLEQSGETLSPEDRSRVFELIVRLLEGLCADGKVSEARTAVSRLLTRQSDNLSEEEQARLIATVETAAGLARAQRAAAKEAEAAARASAALAEDMASVEDKLKKGADQRRKGLLGSRKYTAASRDLHSATKQFESALKDVEQLRGDYAGDDAALASIELLGEEALTQWQDTLLSAASLELARGSFNRSMESVNRILVDYPTNEQALAMRARIEVAQNDWGWR